MNILDAFRAEPRFSRLARRRSNFEKMVEHVWKLSEKRSVAIIETGCAWDRDNWEGQGQSTLIWDWLIQQTKEIPNIISCISVDITPESVKAAKDQTKNVDIFLSDSVKFLNSEVDDATLRSAGLIYLDSYDWTQEKNIESSFHHMAELAAIWRSLSEGCMIVVDDRHGEQLGKHWMVEAFMCDYLKKTPVFKNHQIGWIK